MCLGCGGRFCQSELARFVLDHYNSVVLDAGGSVHGRGVYCCRKESCLKVFLRGKKRLAGAFRCKIIDGVVVDPLEIEKLLGSGSFR